MDHASKKTDLGDDDKMISLLRHILSIRDQVKPMERLSDELLGNKCERYMSPEDLQQAILYCEESLASQSPEHPMYFTVQKALDALSQIERLLSSVTPPIAPPIKQQKNATIIPRQILFEKWETDVEDIEAPLPDPFDIGDRDGGASVVRINKTRNQSAAKEGGPYSGIDGTGKTIEVRVEADKRCIGRTKQLGELASLQYRLQAHRLEMVRIDILFALAIQFSLRSTTLNNLRQAVMFGEEALVALPTEHPGRLIILNKLAPQLYSIYGSTGALDDLQKAIKYGKETLAATSQGHSNRVPFLINIAILLGMRYKRIGSMGDFQQGILYIEQALEATPEGHPSRAGCLKTMAKSFSMRYKKTGATEDLQKAIMYSKEAFRATPPDHPHIYSIFNTMAKIWTSKYKQTKALADLQQAIVYRDDELAAMPQGHPGRSGCLRRLTTQLYLRYQRTGAVDDLQKVIIYCEEVLLTMPQGHPDRAKCLDGLAIYLKMRQKEIGAMGDLQQAIIYSQEALAATPESHPDRPRYLNEIGNSLSARYGWTGSIGDLQQAIVYGQEALAATPESHPGRPLYLSNMGLSLSMRYDRTGSIGDLQQATIYCEKAVAAMPKNHPTRSGCFTNLVGCLSSRYGRTGDMDDLQQAIEYSEEALAAIPQDDPGRASCLRDLAVGLKSRYNRIGAIDDLQLAIIYIKEALAASPQDHPARILRLEDLASGLSTRYQRTGDMDDIQQAIMYYKEVLAVTPQDHLRRAGRLGGLAQALLMKYKRTEAMNDLEEAIVCSEEGLATIPQGHIGRASFLDILADGLLFRYERTRAMNDIEQAIMYGENALVETPEDHPNRSGRFYTLGGHMLFRQEPGFTLLENLDDARLYYRAGWDCSTSPPLIRISAVRSYLRISYLHQLFRYLFHQPSVLLESEQLSSTTEDPPDLGSQELLSIAVDTPDTTLSESQEPSSIAENPPDPSSSGSQELSSKAINSPNPALSESQELSFIARNTSDLDPLISQVLFFVAENPQDILVKQLSFSTDDSALIEGAVLLLPKVSPRLLDQQDQQYNLRHLNGIAQDAASFALLAGKSAYHALKLLELSRGIIMSFAIDSRGDLSDLKKDNLQLFTRFDNLRTEIDGPLSGSQDRNCDFRRRVQAIRELDETIVEIRALPDHNGFQLPPSSDALMSMAKDGPIVVFINAYFRSQAIIVTTSAIDSVVLPKLWTMDIKDRLDKMEQITRPAGLKKSISNNEKMLELLSWLWDVAVEPVVQALKLTAKSETEDYELARIWWIGIGNLSPAPFHAAGHYSKESNRSQRISSYAISSYTPTIKALSYARESDLAIVDGGKPGSQFLLVTMPETPGAKNLPAVNEEVASIINISETSVSIEHLKKPSAEDILGRLELGTCSAVHFACHGISDNKDPSNSHLILLKGCEADKLTVQDISMRKNKNAAQIAYLSACSTANNSDVELADETIHIASAFQLAGFSHVLATMWAADSKTCVAISTEFYRLLFSPISGGGGGGGDGGHRRVAMAFHRAVEKARASNMQKPLKWAPFIHMGA